MSEKCFCHFNGYQVKDATARKNIETINETTETLINDVNVLENRMNTFSSLSEGSTTADAELIDIRVKADGTTATSAGNAVREQVSELKEDLVNLFSISEWNIKNIDLWEFLNINDDTGLNDDNNGLWSNGMYWIMRTKGFVFGKNLLVIGNKTNKVNFKIYKYNTDGTFVSYERYSDKQYITFDERYIYRILLFVDTTQPETIWQYGFYNLTDFINDFNITCYSNSNYNAISWNAVGDSITEGDQGTFYGKPLEDKALYFQRIKDTLHLDGLNCGIGGTTICVNNSVDSSRLGKSFVERICGLNGNTAYRDCNIWTIMGGANDILYNSNLGTIDSTENDIDTIYGALKRIAIYLLSKGSKVIFITDPYTSYYAENKEKGDNINNAIKEVAELYSIPFYDLRKNCGYSSVNLSTMTYDNIHPNPNGTDMYSNRLMEVIKANM